MSISYMGINEQVITFKTESELEPGTLVKVSANKTVSACTDGDCATGVVVSCRENLAAVQISGFTTVKCSGTVLPLGMCKLCAAGKSTVKEDSANGRPVIVLETDTTALTAGILL